MRRILFDKNTPYPLKRFLNEYQVGMAEDEGWAQISNGELLTKAESAGYDILLTCDQNVQHQQNLTGRKMSMVVLGSNIWPSVTLKIEDILAALKRAMPGSFEFVEIPPPAKRRPLRKS